MRVIIQPNYEKLSEWAAAYVVDKINKFNPTAEHPFVLGLPTGSSPIGMYQNLVKAYKEGLVSFKNVITFNMDEYVGLKESHPESYHSFMAKNLFNHIDCPKENIHISERQCGGFGSRMRTLRRHDCKSRRHRPVHRRYRP